MSDTAVYMVTHGHQDVTRRVIELLRKVSGCEFDLFVVDSGSGPKMQNMLQGLATEGKIDWLWLSPENIGQNIGANAALDEIFERGGYDWVVRWSPDVEPKGRRALKKLVRAARMFKIAGAKVITHPKVSGSPSPNPITLTGDDVGFPYYEAEVVKGFVRVAPAEFYRNWRHNPYAPLCNGETPQLKEHCEDEGYAEVVVENIKVKHVGGEPGLIESHISYGL